MREVDLRVDCAAGSGTAAVIPHRGRTAALDGEERGGGGAAAVPARGQSGQGSASVPLLMREVDLRVDCAAGNTTAEVSMLRRRRGMIQGRARRVLGRRPAANAKAGARARAMGFGAED
ncbi:unnamed protein product [Miscanthus lutarioriparius]|uniref:Uncharacterized protein n=1 Tax=Miscanthus lutarioriparius TaxID=422564 RepID=A0A811QN21_9POAL|nr:unnamed protein product [Miscanthus lutarioriparius]